MKKSLTLISVLVLAFAFFIEFAGFSGATDGGISSVMKSNIEALSSGEFNPINECDSWCIDNPNYNCILTTNYGFTITCNYMTRP